MAHNGKSTRYAAGAKYSSQSGRARSTPRTNQVVPWGGRGVIRNCHDISAGVRSPLMLLHRRQQATRFSQLSFPPRERGMTWSIVFAAPPQ